MSPFTMTNGSCALCLFSLTAVAIVLQKQRVISKRRKSLSEKSRIPNSYENEYFPPLPDEVVEVLRTSKLCYLATQSDGNPHLSLMNFTYCRKEEVIILSTRRNTKKFYQIVENPKVAVLIHDFPADSSPRASINIPEPELKNTKQWSITLNGVAEVWSYAVWFFFIGRDDNRIVWAVLPNVTLTFVVMAARFINLGYGRCGRYDKVFQVIKNRPLPFIKLI